MSFGWGGEELKTTALGLYGGGGGRFLKKKKKHVVARYVVVSLGFWTLLILCGGYFVFRKF